MGSPFPKRKLVGKTGADPGRRPIGNVLRSASRSGAEQNGGAAVVRRPDVLALGIGAVAFAAAVASFGVAA